MDPTELEFLAEDELITIVPRVRMEAVDLLDSQVEILFWLLFLRYFIWLFDVKFV